MLLYIIYFTLGERGRYVATMTLGGGGGDRTVSI